MYSTVTVEYSQFMRNEAAYGGAIYGFQESKFESFESIFDENKAMIAVSVPILQLMPITMSVTDFVLSEHDQFRAVPTRTMSTPTVGLRKANSTTMRHLQGVHCMLQVIQ